MPRKELAQDLYQIGAIKFGEFILKSGKKSPYYVDLRILPSFPQVLAKVGKVMAHMIKDLDLRPTRLCGIPAAGLAIATVCGIEANIPVIYTRKEPIVYKDLANQLRNSINEGKYQRHEMPGINKSIELIESLSGFKTHGITRYLDGEINDGDECWIVDDLITTADSKLEARDLIMLEARRKNIKVNVTGVCVLLDREQGGREKLKEEGLELYSIATIREVAKWLYELNVLNLEKYKVIVDYTESEKTNG
ncbi:MAG: orotate phosphoribosyltransferase [Candidatus Bathyarchaeia archaeon]